MMLFLLLNFICCRFPPRVLADNENRCHVSAEVVVKSSTECDSKNKNEWNKKTFSRCTQFAIHLHSNCALHKSGENERRKWKFRKNSGRNI